MNSQMENKELSTSFSNIFNSNFKTTVLKFIKGQDFVIDLLVKSLKRLISGFKANSRPVASFIFCGPTGVGKTQTSIILTKLLFGSLKFLIRLDMSEYMEFHSVSKLVGTPPGYQGYGEVSQFDQINLLPTGGILLIDEFEKAHPRVLDLFLQILDSGFIKNSQGEYINFSNFIIIFTSNLGAKNVFKIFNNKFNLSDTAKYKFLAEAVKSDLLKFLRPEFLNRFDNVFIFKPLTPRSLMKILDNMLYRIKYICKQLFGLKLKIEHPVYLSLIAWGHTLKFGARNLFRTIQTKLENPLVEYIEQNKLSFKNITIKIGISENEIYFDIC